MHRRLLLPLSSAALALLPLLAGAQPAAAPETPPPAAPAAPAVSAVSPLFRPYGTFNPRIVVASGPVESFGQPNEVAVTAAGDLPLAVRPGQARQSFQVQQSRVGLWVNEGGAFRGQLEVDFVDFTKATPTVQALPRLRIARVDWRATAQDVLSLGQDWDLHAPLSPFTLNLVGGMFQGGNVGFMRQQLHYVHTGSGWEAGVALGFAAANATARETALELGPPTLAARAALLLGKSRVGVSALATRLTFAGAGATADRGALAGQVALYGEWVPDAQTTLRVEVNAGQDSANLGVLSIGQGSLAADNRDAGGFLSVRHALSPAHAVYATGGLQRSLTPATALPAYASPATADGSLPAPGSATSTVGTTGPGLLTNQVLRVGYEFRPAPMLALVLEPFLVRSRHALQAADAGRVRAVSASVGVEAGMLLGF